MTDFRRFAQLQMLEHIDANEGAPLLDLIRSYCRRHNWGKHVDGWMAWLAPLAEDPAHLTPEGAEVRDELSATALDHNDARAEELILRLANEHTDDDSVNNAIQSAGWDMPIRHWERLVYRLINAGLLDGFPTDTAHQKQLVPTVRNITDAGVQRLQSLEMARGNPNALFYSWQSDDPERRSRIRRRLQRACVTAGLDYDEATRETSGSPEIHTTIRAKVSTCGLFVADVNIVTGIADPAERPTPNPNVMYELGLADARLPTERIMLLFDGNPDHLPFDIRQRRITSEHGDLEEFVAQNGRDSRLGLSSRASTWRPSCCGEAVDCFDHPARIAPQPHCQSVGGWGQFRVRLGMTRAKHRTLACDEGPGERRTIHRYQRRYGPSTGRSVGRNPLLAPFAVVDGGVHQSLRFADVL